MQSTSPRIRRVVERVVSSPECGNFLRRPARRAREPRRHTGRRTARGGLALDAAALHEREVDGQVRALGCLVWAAAACDPRVPLDALCDAAVELFAGEASDPAGFVAAVLRLAPEELAERGRTIVELATAAVRAARYVALAEVRRALADGGGDGVAAELARRAVGLALDPYNELSQVLPHAIALAVRAARQHDGYAPLVAALTSAREAAGRG